MQVYHVLINIEHELSKSYILHEVLRNSALSSQPPCFLMQRQARPARAKSACAEHSYMYYSIWLWCLKVSFKYQNYLAKSAIFLLLLSDTDCFSTCSRVGPAVGGFNTRLETLSPHPMWGLSTRLCCGSSGKEARPPGTIQGKMLLFWGQLSLKNAVPTLSQHCHHYTAWMKFGLNWACCAIHFGKPEKINFYLN